MVPASPLPGQDKADGELQEHGAAQCERSQAPALPAWLV